MAMLLVPLTTLEGAWVGTGAKGRLNWGGDGEIYALKDHVVS